MSIYQLGHIIRLRREDLGITQEELAAGVCSVPTLSRIENGERMPNKAHVEMLLQRLGYSDTMSYVYVDRNELQRHELKYKIRQAILLNQLQSARDHLNKYIRLTTNPSQIESQFIRLYETLTDTTLDAENRLARLNESLLLTCPRYKETKLPKILSYEEIIILNNIAGCYSAMKEYEQAIRILYHIKRYYENHMFNTEEVLRTQPLILYNLSKCLGAASRYDECIEICDLGIRTARETGRCGYLAWLFYNRAWALIHRNNSGDDILCKDSIQNAIYTATILAQGTAIVHFKNFLKQYFPAEDY